MPTHEKSRSRGCGHLSSTMNNTFTNGVSTLLNFQVMSRHDFFSSHKPVEAEFVLPSALASIPQRPVAEPLFTSLLDYLSFDVQSYMDNAKYDGFAETDDEGNITRDIEDSFAPDNDDLFDYIDNGVDSVMNHILSHRAGGASIASDRPDEEVSELASEPTKEGESEPSL